jgi:hypothetical protein
MVKEGLGLNQDLPLVGVILYIQAKSFFDHELAK